MNTEQGKMSVKNNKKKNWIIPAAVLVVFVLWSLWFWVPVTETIRLDPPDGSDQTVRIALVTDLHSCRYGKDQKDLIDRISPRQVHRPEAAAPDGRGPGLYQAGTAFQHALRR